MNFSSGISFLNAFKVCSASLFEKVIIVYLLYMLKYELHYPKLETVKNYVLVFKFVNDFFFFSLRANAIKNN